MGGETALPADAGAKELSPPSQREQSKVNPPASLSTDLSPVSTGPVTALNASNSSVRRYGGGGRGGSTRGLLAASEGIPPSGSVGAPNGGTVSVDGESSIEKSVFRLLSAKPRNGSWQKSGDVLFSLQFSQEKNCTLIVDDVPVQDFLARDVVSLPVAGLSVGKHVWRVDCPEYTSGEFSFVVRSLLNFSGGSTKMDEVDAGNIVDFTLDLPGQGKIVFLSPVDLRDSAGFENFVLIDRKRIGIDSASVPMLNRPAEITFYDSDFQHPVVFRDGVYCKECIVLRSDGQTVVRVPHFSSYSLSENAELVVNESSDSSWLYDGDVVQIVANYTDVVTNASINGSNVGCFLTIGGSTQEMAFVSRVYAYNATLAAGLYAVNISCDGSLQGYSILNVTELISINRKSGPVGINPEVIRSSRGVYDSATEYGLTRAGNMSEMVVYYGGASQVWQGYFGNVSAQFVLSDSSGNPIYLWNLMSPEAVVFATRAFDVNFPTVGCMSPENLVAEDLYLGKNASEGDSANQTFNRNIHPGFSVGEVVVMNDTCRTTNMYVNNSEQNDRFFELLLSDAANNTIYTTIIENDVFGFNYNRTDFEMMVGVNKSVDIVPYFFYIEL